MKKIISALFILNFILIGEAHAQANLSSMFANFISSGEALIRLVQMFAYVIGIFLVIGSVFKLVQVTQGNGQVTMKTPLVMFFCGIGIFAMTGSISILSQTMAMGSGPGAILLPTSTSLSASSAQAMQGVLLFVRLVGYIAFIRGWLLLNQYGAGKEGTLGRALTHLFGGVAAINITITARILANTFAPGVPMPF